jgi:hypothetical protein
MADHPPSISPRRALRSRRVRLLALTTAVVMVGVGATKASESSAAPVKVSAIRGPVPAFEAKLRALSASEAVIFTPPTAVAPPTSAAPRKAAPKPAPRVTPKPAAPAAPRTSSADPNNPATWDRLAGCEAGGNWAANTGNGYYGGLQFSLSTWRSVGGSGYPHQASRETQIEMGRRLQASSGWGAWPSCSRRLGYR